MKTIKSSLKVFAIVFLMTLMLILLPIDRGVAFLSAKTNGYHVETTYSDAAYRHYYNKLTPVEQSAYNYIYAEIKDFPESVYIPTLESKELNRVFEALLYDNPELYFLDTSCDCYTIPSIFGNLSCRFVPTYRMNPETYVDMQKKVEAAAAEILAGAPKGSDFEKELYVHDTIIRLCDYGTQDYDTYPTVLTVYGALVEKAPICEGYARTAQYLLKQLGIPSYVVIGTATNPDESNRAKTSETHMWNVVELDGKEYALDLTWDDFTSVGKEAITDDPSHIYFNISGKELSKSHVPETEKEFLTSKASAQNYFVKKDLFFDEFGAKENLAVRDAIVAALNHNATSVELKFKTDAAYQAAKTALITRQGIYPLIDSANAKTAAEKRISASSIRYSENTVYRVLSLYFYR